MCVSEHGCQLGEVPLVTPEAVGMRLALQAWGQVTREKPGGLVPLPMKCRWLALHQLVGSEESNPAEEALAAGASGLCHFLALCPGVQPHPCRPLHVSQTILGRRPHPSAGSH